MTRGGVSASGGILTVTTTDHSPLRRREAGGWAVMESEPGRVQARVLMLPGLFCTSEFFTDVLADEALAAAGVAALAADPPGFAGQPAPAGFEHSIESYAALVEEFAARESIDLIIGHSYGAADAAALHLLDVASGRWNDALARGALGGEPVVLVHLWRRDQGLVLGPGNPLGPRAGRSRLPADCVAPPGHGLAPATREPDAAGGL
jgi:Alpha/beta hydrolase family/PBP superfamily domain